MKFLRYPTVTVFGFIAVLLFVCMGSSCEKTPPVPPPSDPRADFARSLKGVSADGFNFAIEENQNEIITSLTKPAKRERVKLEGDITVVLRYASIKDKKTNTVTTYKTEAVKAGKNVSIVVTDIGSGTVISKDDFPPSTDGPGSGQGDICSSEPKVDSFEECGKIFDCTKRAALLEEANRTCKTVRGGYLCCFNNGQIWDVLVLITPTSLRCNITGGLSDSLELEVRR